MSSDNPPNNYFDGIGYNSLFYNTTDTGTGLTQAQADLLYLSKKITDTSTAPLTTFNNSIYLKNTFTLYDTITPFTNYVEILQSNLITTFRQLFNSGRFDFIPKNSGGTNTTSLTIDSTGITVNGILKTVVIQSANTTSNNRLFDNVTTGGTITIGSTAGTNTINGSTNFISSILSRTNLKLCEWGNYTGNALVLTFPLEQVVSIRPTSGTSMTLQLPAITNNERGMVFKFIKVQSGLNVTISTSASNQMYLTNNISVGVTSTATLLSSDKLFTTLAVGWFGSVNYWFELSDYSLFDRDQLPKLAIANTFTNTNIFNQEVKIPTRLTLKGVQYANEVQTVSGTSATLTFPLEQVIMLTSTGATNINITLPTITASSQVGTEFSFIKTGSLTNSVIFTAGGTNQIWGYNSITNNSPITLMVGNTTTSYFIILEVTTGVFVWREV